MKINERPTTEDMRSWIGMLSGEWNAGDSSLDSQQSQEEDTYFQKFQVETWGGANPVRTGSAPSDADAAIDSLTPEGDVLVNVKPARGRKKYEDQATKLSYFGKAQLAAWRRKRDVIRDVVSNQVIRRVGISRVLFDQTIWPQMPKDIIDDMDSDDETVARNAQRSRTQWEARHRRRSPIIFESRNPRYVRWREYNGDLLVVCEQYTTKALEAMTVWGHLPPVRKILQGREPNDTLTVGDCWYGEWRCLFLDDMPIFPGTGKSAGVLEHGYPEIPYAIAPFRELPFEEEWQHLRGMLSNALNLYQMESQVLTMHIQMLRWNAWRSYQGWTRDGRELEIRPGFMTPVDEVRGEYLKMIEGQPVPPELMNTYAMVSDVLQKNSVASGPRTAEGTRSGQQLWAIQAMRALKIDAPKSSLQKMLERSLSLAAQIIEQKIKDPITLPIPGKDRDGQDLGEVRIGPDDIDGYYDGFEVRFSRRLDPALLEQAKALSVLSLNNWMPLQVSYEYSGLTDAPQEWLDMLLDQSTERLDFVLEIIALERAKATYGEHSEIYQALYQKLMVQQQAQQAAAAGGGAPEGAPGVPSGGNTAPSMKGPVETGAGPGAGWGASVSQSMGARGAGRMPRGNQRRSPPNFGAGGLSGGV